MHLLKRLQQINTFIFDVDGVLTNGEVLLLEDGQQARTMNTKDGYALQYAIKKGYKVIVISGGKAEAVRIRLQKLGVQEIFLGVEDKLACMRTYLETNPTPWNEMLFMGDDLPDYTIMQLVGIATCPLDAVHEIKALCAYISPSNGGKGCVRDIIEKVMRLRGDWELATTITSV